MDTHTGTLTGLVWGRGGAFGQRSRRGLTLEADSRLDGNPTASLKIGRSDTNNVMQHTGRYSENPFLMNRLSTISAFCIVVMTVGCGGEQADLTQDGAERMISAISHRSPLWPLELARYSKDCLRGFPGWLCTLFTPTHHAQILKTRKPILAKAPNMERFLQHGAYGRPP